MEPPRTPSYATGERDLELLRLHVEAVWGIHLPPPALGDSAPLPGVIRPPWTLYLAEMAGGRVRLWRPDVAPAARPGLVTRAEEALVRPPEMPAVPGIACEVALRHAESPTLDLAAARRIARPIERREGPLVDTFEWGASAYYLATPDRAPIFGVVADGRLLSVAHSSRRTPSACELGISTRPDARRQGYALAATVLWTHAVAAQGRVPLYSALAANAASLALAAAAGYRPFARAAYLTL